MESLGVDAGVWPLGLKVAPTFGRPLRTKPCRLVGDRICVPYPTAFQVGGLHVTAVPSAGRHASEPSMYIHRRRCTTT
ncbi:unnamed protein product [Ectocarpus sp. 13 AM-2016]